ncbi:hypothetical protein LARI1_G001974 [Lachnellula arida]|uniref:BTB domain-containing protein n=1 Tax=Lachnellula arida TaxID=1316785 RepID=A0A8T9BRD9_9HELO|nr:hypothetical protein LARI1_G001974 [Lachnellula arida]
MASPKTNFPPPIIFTSRGVKPDVLLEVLGQDFHVMSPALKIHSAFFAAFLDSSNKAPTTPANPNFKYHWGTNIDKDGSWGLVSIGCLEESEENHELKEDAQIQVEGFRVLMCAIHSTPFAIAIDGIEVLDTATILADYYRALPILSIAVSAVLFSRPDFLFEIQSIACAS